MSHKNIKQESKHRDSVLYPSYQLLQHVTDKSLDLPVKVQRGQEHDLQAYNVCTVKVSWFMWPYDQMIPYLNFLYNVKNTKGLEIFSPM